MMPVVDSLAKKYVHRSIIAKIDTSKNSRTSSFMKIQGVPCFLLFNKGEIVDRVVGEVAESILEQKINSLI